MAYGKRNRTQSAFPWVNRESTKSDPKRSTMAVTRSLVSNASIGFSVAIVVLLLALVPTGSPVATVLIDLELEHASFAETYWNDFQEPPGRVMHPGGARSVLEFALSMANIFRLRIDPTERPGETVV